MFNNLVSHDPTKEILLLAELCKRLHLPLENVDNVRLIAALNEAVDNEQVKNFHDYVAETWMDRAAPRFPRAIWSHHDNIGPSKHTLMFLYMYCIYIVSRTWYFIIII